MRFAYAGSVAVACTLAAPTATAQSDTSQSHAHRQGRSHGAQPAGHSSPGAGVIVNRSSLVTSDAARIARERMRSGDCAGALDAFDQAVEEQPEDATLRRDRGTCHDALGQPYPAIEDFRAYLTTAPDALDADAVRGRLERLQDEVAGRAPAGDANAPGGAGATGKPPPGGAGGAAGPPSLASSDDDVPPKENAMKGIDDDEPGGESAEPVRDSAGSAKTADDERPRSSLRAGRGFALAPFVSARKWFRDGRSFGDGETWAECIGGELRYSMGSRAAMLLEVGYERLDTTNVDVETASGLTSLLELELRFPFNARYDNQILLSPGAGYETLSYSPGTDSSTSPYSEGAVTGRLRVSYRHMLAESVAFDVSLEGGYARFFPMNNPSGDLHSPSAGLAGLNVAFLWGL